MTIRALYRNFQERLLPLYSENEATIITDWLMESIGQFTKTDLLLSPDKEISKLTRQRIEIGLQELLEHKPIQYVLGEAWFYKMKLKVNEHVLIPRPETEELVLLIKNEELKIKNNESNILDIGTGSGCIAIALKKELPYINITAIDISNEALSVAKENATIQNTAINFLQKDFLDENSWNDLRLFDVIVSNPPYIPINEKKNLDKNVTAYEPHSALFVPDNTPLLFYEKIAAFGKKHLAPNGKIFVETHENYAKETAALFSTTYQIVEIKKDMFGKERMVTASQFR